VATPQVLAHQGQPLRLHRDGEREALRRSTFEAAAVPKLSRSSRCGAASRC